MPTAAIKSLAKKHGMKVRDVERTWNRVKEKYESLSPGRKRQIKSKYAYIMGATKRALPAIKEILDEVVAKITYKNLDVAMHKRIAAIAKKYKARWLYHETTLSTGYEQEGYIFNDMAVARKFLHEVGKLKGVRTLKPRSTSVPGNKKAVRRNLKKTRKRARTKWPTFSPNASHLRALVKQELIKRGQGVPLRAIRGKKGYYATEPSVSWLKSKKLVVLVKKGSKMRVIHFGAAGYSDYTQHRDPERRRRYLARSAKIKGANDPFSANYWARKILW